MLHRRDVYLRGMSHISKPKTVRGGSLRLSGSGDELTLHWIYMRQRWRGEGPGSGFPPMYSLPPESILFPQVE